MLAEAAVSGGAAGVSGADALALADHAHGVDLVAVMLVDRHGVRGGETRVFDAGAAKTILAS